MKIAFIIPSLGFGGAERVISILANSFATGNEVYIILVGNNESKAYEINEAVRVVDVYSGSVIKTWLGVRNFCKRNMIDVAIAFMLDIGIMSSLSLAFTKTKVIASERNDPFVENKHRGLKLKVLGKISPFFTSGYVFQSNGAKDYYPKSSQKKSKVILNPLDCEKLPERIEAEIDNRIVSVGRLKEQKNQKMLIEAFALSWAKDSHTLHIYGEGPLRKELESQILEMGLQDKVFLEGNSRHVHDDIKNAKLFAFTSNYEGLPNALIEAMAMGIPCVSTDCSPGGARMLIEDGINGRLVECGNANAFSQALDDTVFDVEKLQMYGKNAIKIRDNVDTSKIASEWLDFIDVVVNDA